MLSAARAELFDLFEEVTSKQGEKIILVHRGSSRTAALVDGEYLERLEQLARRPSGPTEPFRIFGSATLRVPPEEVLQAVRAEQRALGEKKEPRFAAARRASSPKQRSR
jgi:hypothetical protein